MEEANKKKFEAQWKDAFEGAEWPASEKVWTNIELELHKAGTGRMKKRLLMYQLLAAASLVFALGIGGVAVFRLMQQQEPGNSGIAESTIIAADAGSENETTFKANESSAQQNENQLALKDESESLKTDYHTEEATKKTSILASSDKTLSLPIITSADNDLNASRYANVNFVTSKSFAGLYAHEIIIDFKIPEPVSSITDYALLLTADYTPDNLDKNKRVEEKMWTGLSMAAGSFGSGPLAGQAFSYDQASFAGQGSTSGGAGSTYRVGLMMGGRLADKWVLQGGIAYMNQFTDYVSNLASADGKVLANFSTARAETSSVGLTSPYQLNSNQQFLSVPMQAGYLLLDKKFVLQLNAGFATDFFIQNTMNDGSGNLNSFSERAGADAAYRTVNFSSLAGTEISYRFGDHYRLALAPGMRYAMHSLLKAETNSTFQPLTLDVALRFNYLFK